MRGRTVSAITLARLIEDADLGKGPVGAVREPPLTSTAPTSIPPPLAGGG